VSKDLDIPEKSEAKQRLWVVSEVYYPEQTSTGYYLTAIAEGLTDCFDVKVLCGQPNYSARGTIAPEYEIHKSVEIFRAAGTTLNKNVLTLKFINMITLSISMFFKAIMNFRRGDKVLVVTTPPTMPFIIALAALIKGSSHTLLIHDCYPEVLVAVGKLKKDSFLVRTIDFFNRWLYKNANKIIVVGRDMNELISRKSLGLDVPIVVIQNWAELEDVRPTERSQNKLIKELKIENKLIILHAGNIGYPTDVETVLDVLERLVHDDRFHFVFIGDGIKRKKIENAIENFGLKNLTLLKSRPREEQIDFLNACDVGLVSLVSGMFGAAMPSKTYNILAAGKPILALTDEGSELAQVIDDGSIGWHLAPGNADQLEAALTTIYDRMNELQSIGQRSRHIAEKDYSLDLALKRYKAALS